MTLFISIIIFSATLFYQFLIYFHDKQAKLKAGESDTEGFIKRAKLNMSFAIGLAFCALSTNITSYYERKESQQKNRQTDSLNVLLSKRLDSLQTLAIVKSNSLISQIYGDTQCPKFGLWLSHMHVLNDISKEEQYRMMQLYLTVPGKLPCPNFRIRFLDILPDDEVIVDKGRFLVFRDRKYRSAQEIFRDTTLSVYPGEGGAVFYRTIIRNPKHGLYFAFLCNYHEEFFVIILCRAANGEDMVLKSKFPQTDAAYIEVGNKVLNLDTVLNNVIQEHLWPYQRSAVDFYQTIKKE
ncbi:MAG: hypothetical protein U0T73_00530 [Chitinophagales bacterium]